MNLQADPIAGEDLSALAWVQDELRRTLDNAHRALRRYVREVEGAGSSDVDSADPAVLRQARVQLHQGVGALELVALPAVAQVLRAGEAAVQRMLARPKVATPQAVETIEQASFAVLDYLARMLAGKPVPTLALFPQYAAVQALAGAERVHPADLWQHDWQWRQLPADTRVTPRAADDLARGEMEGLTLALMRGSDPAGPLRMSDLCAELGAGASGELATLWRLASAFFEAQAAQLVEADVYTKRVASRLLAQLRGAIKGDAAASERLAQDLLFYCVRAEMRDPTATLRLAAVQSMWPGDPAARTDYVTARLGLFDPAVVQQARKRVTAAKDAWSQVAGGELQRLPGLGEAFVLLADSVQRLFPEGAVLAQGLQDAAARCAQQHSAPQPEHAMEVATALLYVEAVLDDGEFDPPELGARVQRLAQRIREVGAGAEAQPLEAWMEELYRRISDRQTMGSVVQELRSSLTEIEKQIDQYFRDPAQRQLLIPVPGQLSAMRGVLTVLGLDQASQAVLHMRDRVDALAQTEVDPQRVAQAGTFERLADNLGALSFLIDMLSVQPQLAKTLFRFDADTGMLSAVMGQSDRATLPAFAATELTPAAEPAPEPVPELTLDTVPGLVPTAAPTVPVPAQAPVASGLEDDAEMREIFLEEAREVIAGARASLARLEQVADELAELTSVRRAFHTLKGSSRMVGLKAFGEAAWSCEQLYNARLAQQARMDAALAGLSTQAVDYLADWVEAIADGADRGHDPAAVARAADALREQGQALPIAPAVAPGSEAPIALPLADEIEAPMPSELPQVAELPELADLSDLAELPTEAEPTEVERTDVLSPLFARVPDLPTAADLDLAAQDLPAELPELVLELPDELPSELAAEPPADLPEPAPAALGEPLQQAAADTPAESAAPGAEPVWPDFTLDLAALEDEPAEPAELTEPAEPAEPAQALPLAQVLELPAQEFELSFETPAEPMVADEVAAAAAAVEHAQYGEHPALAGVAPVEPETLQPAAVPVPDLFEEPVPAVEADAPPVAAADATPADAPDQALPTAAGEGAGPLEPAPAPDDEFKLVGELRIPIPLFNIYLNEADEQSRRLGTEIAEWSLEPHRAPADSTVAMAHSLAGNSATVGFADLSLLARTLEHALMRSQAMGCASEGEPALFGEAAEEIRRLLHQFAAGFLKEVNPQLMARLLDHEVATSTPERDTELPALDDGFDGDDFELRADEPAVHTEPEWAADVEAVDAVDPDLFPIFEEEADELLPQLRSRLADWMRHPADTGAAAACLRTLHTFKGGARLAGAMRVGELAHRLEAEIEQLAGRDESDPGAIERLLARADTMASVFELLRARPSMPAAVQATAETAALIEAEPDAEPDTEAPPVAMPVLADPALRADLLPDTGDTADSADAAAAATESDRPAAVDATTPLPVWPAAAPVAAEPPRAIDWERFVLSPAQSVQAEDAPADAVAHAAATVRVRAPLLDRLVNQAGEISITRARIESATRTLQGSLEDLTDNLDKLRRHLRDIELQAETQISSRMEAAKAAAQAFDPLEMDRFTRFQELTRMMAESVNDVATVQRGLQRALQSSEDELALQARLTRELQGDLLRTRMVEFESLADRLYRVVRLAAKETGKSVRLDILGGAIEVDRGVLERMVGPFEHLLRNAVAHGIEPAAQRLAAGKPESGTITISAVQEGNEVAVEVRDDGAGLDLARIRARALERGLLAADATPSDAEVAQLIFLPGFSTADAVTGLAGRGVGMDVVRAEVMAMGGRVQTDARPGHGTAFRLLLPLTTAVTQVVMLRFGERQVAVPSTLVEVVRREKAALVEAASAAGVLAHEGEEVPLYWLGALLQAEGHGGGERSQTVVVLRSAAQRVAVHVDEVIGNQEVVVKNVGPQLAHLPGLAGVTLLPSGAVATIYNPVALAAVYGEEARARMRAKPRAAPLQPQASSEAVALAPLVLVVDDSLTVRRVTQRLLLREGYRVQLAKDGMEALERLAEERPAVLLSDIEMPRMDGFDLVRNVRADPRLAQLPVIMITSRIAQKHRDYAAELGVDHYLGKPYAEDELLALVARHVQADIAI